jgi:uncharacterized iron-regulated protein
MKVRFFLFAAFFFLLASMRTDKPAYQFFRADGKTVDYDKVLKEAGKADIIFFGEIHNSPICHWLQIELTKDLFTEKKENLVLGVEMFETDNQLILDEYLQGRISEKNFTDEAKLWKNYNTDYKPLINFAKESHLPVIATNIPRRYASMVNKGGFEVLDSLTPTAKKFIAPLPIAYDPELKGYKDMLNMGMEGGHTSPNLPKAQAIKDATMANSILNNRKDGMTFLHFNGTYHSDNFQGILWYIRQRDPNLKIMTISSIEQDTIEELKPENMNLADFILCVPSDMTKTQ